MEINMARNKQSLCLVYAIAATPPVRIFHDLDRVSKCKIGFFMKAFLLQYLVFVFIGSCPSDDANLIIIFLIFMSQFVM